MTNTIDAADFRPRSSAAFLDAAYAAPYPAKLSGH